MCNPAEKALIEKGPIFLINESIDNMSALTRSLCLSYRDKAAVDELADQIRAVVLSMDNMKLVFRLEEDKCKN